MGVLRPEEPRSGRDWCCWLESFVGTAALDAWEVSGDVRYFEAARALAEFVLARFADPEEGGFFDIEQRPGQALVGALAARRKPLQDAPDGYPLTHAILDRLGLIKQAEENADEPEEESEDLQYLRFLSTSTDSSATTDPSPTKLLEIADTIIIQHATSMERYQETKKKNTDSTGNREVQVSTNKQECSCHHCSMGS